MLHYIAEEYLELYEIHFCEIYCCGTQIRLQDTYYRSEMYCHFVVDNKRERASMSLWICQKQRVFLSPQNVLSNGICRYKTPPELVF